MFTSIVVTPNLLISLKENTQLSVLLKEFGLKYSHNVFKEVLILILKGNQNYLEKYSK